MPTAELSELLFIAMMFLIVITISTVSIFLFVRQFKREKKATEAEKLKKSAENEIEVE